MDATPDHDLAAHVAAWHNRHPLARRITPAQVQGMGVLALPFAASKGKNKGSLRSAFSDHFIAPLGARRVARFTLRYGTSTRTGPADWPQRDLTVKPGGASTAAIRYLRTAAIDLRNQRTRVLIGGGKTPQVLGQRLWSGPRLVAAASVLGTVLLILAAALGRFSVPARQGPLLAVAAAAASTPTSAASHAAAALQAASGAPINARAPATAASGADTVQGEASSTPTPPASALTLKSPAGASASDPASVAAGDTFTGRANSSTRDIRPALPTGERDAARKESRDLRAGRPERAGKTGIAGALSASATASGSAAAASGESGRTYAVATPVTRTRAAAQLRIVLMNAPTYAEPGQPHAEVMQTSNGWRTVVWPYNTREAAERIREGLATRGIPAEVVEF